MAKKLKKNKNAKDIKHEIGEKVLDRITNLSKKLDEKPSDELALSFYDIFRDFFAKFFKISFAFTFEELSHEIERKRIDPRYKDRVKKLAKRLTYMEYSHIEITNKVLKDMINDFKYFVKKLTFPKKEKKKVTRKLDKFLKELSKKTNLFKKLKLKKVKEPAKKLILEPEPKISEKTIYNLLQMAYNALISHKTDEAKQIYTEIMKIYNVLPIEKKEKVHGDILRVFRPKHKSDIDKLIVKIYYFMGKRDVENTGKAYNDLEEVYKQLSEREKEFYYPKIAELYENIKIIFS